jgi:hypothetical protein
MKRDDEVDCDCAETVERGPVARLHALGTARSVLTSACTQAAGDYAGGAGGQYDDLDVSSGARTAWTMTIDLS